MVATVLADLAEDIDRDQLARLAIDAPTVWIQRLEPRRVCRRLICLSYAAISDLQHRWPPVSPFAVYTQKLSRKDNFP